MTVETSTKTPRTATTIADALTFPADASSREQLRFLLEFAVRAPSGHNTQPWLFRLSDDYVDLIADRTRALPVVDPFDRELTISCGAAIDHMAVAARHFCHELFNAMSHRSTTRQAFEDEPLADELANRCKSVAAKQEIELTLISDRAERMAIGELVAEGDKIQFADPRFRRELASWFHSRRSSTQDGMSGSAFGMPDSLSSIGALVIRTFDMEKALLRAMKRRLLTHRRFWRCFPVPAMSFTTG